MLLPLPLVLELGKWYILEGGRAEVVDERDTDGASLPWWDSGDASDDAAGGLGLSRLLRGDTVPICGCPEASLDGGEECFAWDVEKRSEMVCCFVLLEASLALRWTWWSLRLRSAEVGGSQSSVSDGRVGSTDGCIDGCFCTTRRSRVQMQIAK